MQHLEDSKGLITVNMKGLRNILQWHEVIGMLLEVLKKCYQGNGTL